MATSAGDFGSSWRRDVEHNIAVIEVALFGIRQKLCQNIPFYLNKELVFQSQVSIDTIIIDTL